jgi:hypothetical protein
MVTLFFILTRVAHMNRNMVIVCGRWLELSLSHDTATEEENGILKRIKISRDQIIS